MRTEQLTATDVAGAGDVVHRFDQMAPGRDERLCGAMAHLGSLVLGLMGPMLFLVTEGRHSSFVRSHAEEAVNFQLTALIAFMVSCLALFVYVGYVMLAVVVVGFIYETVQAGRAAHRGESYRYPIAISFIK